MTVKMKARGDRESFAQSWIAAWNRRDVEWVLATYAEELTFTSPTAHFVTGHATIKGKLELRAYWHAALEKVDHLHFVLDRVIWDDETRELGIVYTREVDGNIKRAIETFRFGVDGLVVATDVFHGPLGD